MGKTKSEPANACPNCGGLEFNQVTHHQPAKNGNAQVETKCAKCGYVVEMKEEAVKD